MPTARTADIPLDDDFGADEVSPYRRRPKTVSVHSKRWARVQWLLRGLAFVLFVLLPVGYAGYRAAVFALTSSLFTLRSAADVTVEGNHNVSAEDVLSALGTSASPAAGRQASGVNIFRLSLRRARRDVESIPWVRSATLTRAYPHHLTVHVEERVPVAFLSVDGRMKLVDSEGVVLEPPDKSTFDFPVIEGLEGLTQAERRGRIGLYQEFARQVANQTAASGWAVSEVNLVDSGDLRAVVVQGTQTVELHFGDSDFEPRFRSFLALLPELSKGGTRLESMDLRYRNQIVVNPQAGDAGTQKE
ncbi:MAG TPA: FtsQ-type POTRA domain-containing protein [Terriglobia bacterium]|nr:FtsQ-type POTRA domain-containing protein [Terriglobia bacterium]